MHIAHIEDSRIIINIFTIWVKKIKKVQSKKKLMKSNKSISRKKFFFYQIPFFAISKMAKNQFLNWENYQKCNFMKQIC